MRRTIAITVACLFVLFCSYQYIRRLAQKKNVSLSRSSVEVTGNMREELKAQEFAHLDKVAHRIQTEKSIVLIVLVLSAGASVLLLMRPYLSKS